MDVTRLLSEQHGYDFEYLELPSFVAEMKRRATRDDLIYPLVDFFGRAQRKIIAMEHKRYDNRSYRQARQLLARGRADPSLAETVSYLVEFMRREGLIGGGACARRSNGSR